MKTNSKKYRPNYNRLAMAYRNAVSINDFAFHVGYQLFVVPRCVRKVLAKTALHRSWLSGFTGLGIAPIMELDFEPEPPF